MTGFLLNRSLPHTFGFGEIKIIDGDKDHKPNGVFDKGDKIVNSKTGKELSSKEIKNFKKKYNLDLFSSPKFRLSGAALFVQQQKLALEHAAKGDVNSTKVALALASTSLLQHPKAKLGKEWNAWVKDVLKTAHDKRNDKIKKYQIELEGAYAAANSGDMKRTIDILGEVQAKVEKDGLKFRDVLSQENDDALINIAKRNEYKKLKVGKPLQLLVHLTKKP